jgi:sulfite reductase (ferredoxin)
MQRIKIPFGGLHAEHMETLADVAEEYSDAICHVTTRQDFQLHFVHIDDTPDLMRRLAAVGITTLEACGNVVRNVTACPLAGVCSDESFDVTPYARALAYFLLGHKDAQDFGRKFKTAFSGCTQHACGLTNMHDLGLIAQTRLEQGQRRRGFAFFVGGGLGSVPHQAQLLEAFVPEDELLPLAQAVCRVFARLGEKRNRARARLKFLVVKLGMEEFRRLVLEELDQLPPDERWSLYLDDLQVTDEHPTRPAQPLGPGPFSAGFSTWMASNAIQQSQPGYAVATICLPLGDITAQQMRALAHIARR